jgi:NAD(P)H-hydrate epimerase
MRRADRHVTEAFGVPSLLLMENAGRGAAEAVERHFGSPRGRRIVVVAGKGQNGGDGLVAARHLAARGAAVESWVVGRGGDVTGDAGVNLAALRRAGLAVHEAGTDGAGLDGLRAALAGADLVVDALLGTGVRGPATGAVAAAIEAINAARRRVCALDLPSGLPSEGGETPGPTVRADLTVTLGLPKLALYLPAGRARAGRVVVADLGVPAGWLATGARAVLLEAADVRAVVPRRGREAHKGTEGHLLLVAGSRGKTGAAVLAGRAALRAGVGLLTCAGPASQQPLLAAPLPEGMTEPLPETAAASLAAGALDRLLDLAAARDAVALGPGVGLDPETQGVVRGLVARVERPMVVDADALTALAGHLECVREALGPRLLTPHPGEAGRLLGLTAGEVQRDRVGSVRRLADATGAVVALKGAGTLVATPGGEVAVNPTGNPALATGGTGDVLTGVAGALLARGLEPAAALRVAVYLHGLAGDVVAERVGEGGLLAGEVADALPEARRRLGREQ